MAPRLSRVPSVSIEVLRLLVVMFGASLGYELSDRIAAAPIDGVLGANVGPWMGPVLGAMLGYVLGGVVARLVLRSLERGERALDGLQPEQVVAGGFGALIAAALAALLCWPVFLFGPPLVVVPTFVFLVVVACLFGFRVGRTRRDAMLGAVSGPTGMSQRTVAVSSLPRLVDTSIAIDGRILDVVRSGFLHGRFLLAQPVIDELQAMADSSDDLRRAKGRRGMTVLESLRHEQGVEMISIGDEAPALAEVDAKLVRTALDRGAALLTLDTNLAKAASLAGARVLNLHQLALALRPPVVVGDEVTVHLLKPGKDAGQAVGYLDDGTMVVAENSRDRIGQEALVLVTSVLTTANGRMIFVKPAAAAAHR